MKKKVLVTNLMMLNEKDRFNHRLKSLGFDVLFAEVAQYLNEQQLLEIVGDFDGWLAGDDEVTRKVLQKSLPKLKVISKWGTGIDSIDLESAEQLGIKVCNTPGAFGDAVAEVALSYLLDLARKTTWTDRQVRLGKWPKPVSEGLVNKTLGIVGFGAIGRGIAERASAFKMNILASDPVVTDARWARLVTLEELLCESDYVCFACNLNKFTYRLLNKETIALMKPGSAVINVARGPLIDESAMIEALSSGKLSAAALDVYEVEPLSMNSKLRIFENVVLGSHNANNMLSAIEHVHENTLQNLIRFI